MITQFVMFKFVLDMQEICLKLRRSIKTQDLAKLLSRSRMGKLITFLFLFIANGLILGLWMILELPEWADSFTELVPAMSLAYLIVTYVILILQLYIAFIFMDVLTELLQRKAMANWRQMGEKVN